MDLRLSPNLCRGQLKENVSLARYTSWRVGGPADYLFIPADLQDLALFLKQLSSDIPLTWLGLGSNTLIRDGGVAGVVIVTQGSLNQMTSTLTPFMVRAEAGIASAQLARYSARLGGKGLEFMAGIPGTVGGALAMNAGCFGGETWQQVSNVEVITRAGEIKLRAPADFQVAYRRVEGHQNEWFVAGHFCLEKGDKEESLQKIRLMLEKRNAAQPTGTANCGSVFRNPPGDYAARLIELCGLKGKRLGGALVSEKHANFILNHNGASAQEIETLIAEVSNIVQNQTGVKLIREVRIIGRA